MRIKLSFIVRSARLRPHSTTPTRAIPHEDPREDVGISIEECGLYDTRDTVPRCNMFFYCLNIQ